MVSVVRCLLENNCVLPSDYIDMFLYQMNVLSVLTIVGVQLKRIDVYKVSLGVQCISGIYYIAVQIVLV